ncbi:MAG: geranylgeranyl reductase family protein [Anaerolineae bacterium]|jgi:digeranylgeranylglycerophospholipid reductase
MISVDHDRCVYCGGCVSVCPVGALTLAETRLVVGDDCIDCGDCELACPVGALRVNPAERTARAPLRRSYDVVVVGAGPAGSTAARVAAEAGLSVLLLEKRQEIGSPVRCAEGVGHDALIQFTEPDPLWIAAEVDKAEIISLVDGETRTLRAEGGRGYVLERRVFDRVLAEQAAHAGVDVRVKTAVTGLLMDGGRVRGVSIQRGDFFAGGKTEVQTSVVVAADGVEAQVGRWAGLNVQLPLRDTLVCAQYLLAGIELDPTCTRYVIGRTLAPGGYAWVFPKGEGKANVGLGVQADLWQAGGPSKATVLDALIRFIESQLALAQGCPVTLVAGNVPSALPPPRLVTDGLMLVGDAARQVDPLTGGGITNAMMAGKLAAKVAAEAIAAGDTSAEYLDRYGRAWRRDIGRKMARNYRLRERYPPGQRTDQRFVRAFALAVGG